VSEPLRLTETQHAFVVAARRAVLVTLAPDGRPRPIPICHALDRDGTVLWTPIDAKPKASDDPLRLARVRDVLARPRVSVLVDRWTEDWAGLAWVRLDGSAVVLPAPGPQEERGEHDRAVAGLRDRYAPYRDHDLASRPLIRITVERVTEWHAT